MAMIMIFVGESNDWYSSIVNFDDGLFRFGVMTMIIMILIGKSNDWYSSIVKIDHGFHR